MKIARSEQEWDDAVVQRDADALRRIAAEDYANFSALGTVSGHEASIQGREEARQAGPSQVDHNDRTMVSIRLFGDTAIVSGRVQGVMKDGSRASSSGRYLHTWRRRNGRWELIGDHFATLPSSARKRNAIGVAPEVLRSIAGRYRLNGETVALRPNNDDLQFVDSGRTYQLFPETESLFFDRSSGATWVFVRDPSGRLEEVILNGATRVARIE